MLLCFIFFGGTLGQSIYYFRQFTRDGLTLKGLVVSLFLLDTVKAFLHAQLLSYWFVNHHSDASILLLLPLSYTVHFIISTTCVFLVQGLYIRNIWALLRGRWYQNYVTGVGVALATISLACGLVAAHDILTSISDVEAIQRVEVSGRIEGYTAVAVDVYITAVLCFIFHRARTGYEPTENLIFRLMAFTINRGILLFVIQLLVIVTYRPNGTQALDGVYCFAGTLNVNCALATLNARSGRGDLIASQLSSFDAHSGTSPAGGHDESTDDLHDKLQRKASEEK
ncbi:uncharacterized protein B0H18DRAFT_1214858 [Fomitopsis serialis]|uniref:uncharacterized protein n=1 Tax=Fomitopsis serialis TaxID=139415 RepID=UPI002007AA04|nr:uncharacterized protein B0H18DRAFT_1214858 [Neoantrodia serialis]KAH9916850.1 hypothetical protein B0H18DRAFT_1214858 [Neoantrodia serialis]